MADRSLRGMRLGTTSMQSEEGVEYSPRRRSTYRTSDGEEFEVVFAAEAEVPAEWESPKSGRIGVLLDEGGAPVEQEPGTEKAARTHWDMLLERRTEEELEELLQERLTYLRQRRGQEKIGA
ncbi:RNA polymerase-binding protein RbpA [Galbitalea sp. SE-J8]|uniref:RNA polymerase-binding protein RbpA n=1 Tax=Galbitalea sp. SE-J8 TaxID=3054952 RepID=UPI00259D25F1|nr:RNA polymerase-binding protein RbpA [Galbitalea sp. SE-J8]MDM4764009.1 RNA polymerase-binding protein RbpA [Galbitalea sp. SE-J8]